MTSPELSRFSRPMLIVGCGTMAGAMVQRWLACGLDPALLSIIRPSGAAVADGVAVFPGFAQWAASGRGADIVLLGVKPQMLGGIAADIAALDDVLLVSMLAGVNLDILADRFPASRAQVRLMPNTPVALGRGVTLTAASADVPGDDRSNVDTLVSALGLGVWLDDESQFDLLTAFTGSGPAFVYRLADAYRSAGERLGIDPALADKLARATFDGAAAMVQASDAPMAQLADKVASKGGMTQAGLDVLDSDGQTIKLIADTLRAARDRARELADMARGG